MTGPLAGDALDATPSPASARKAGLLGAVIGLAFVALFVIGARLAYHPGRDVTAAPPPVWPQASAPPAPSAAPAPPPPAPAPAAIDSAAAQIQPKRTWPVARPAGPTGVPAAAKTAARAGETPSEGALSGASVGSAPAVATTTATGQAAPPADSASSLIPVIPPSAPPELDPLVKAVLEDDTPHRK